jgi:hypothetical protein
VDERRRSLAAFLWLIAVFVGTFELAWWFFWHVMA